MAFMDFFTGKPGGWEQVSTVSPQQSQFMNSLLQNLGPQASQAFNFQPIAQAATNRFEQQTLPSIAERFAGMGSKRSSGYNQAMANAYENLQTNLAGQQAQFGLQSQGNLAKLLGLGLKPKFENIYMEGQESPFASILPYLIHAGVGIATGGASLPISAGMLGAGTADVGPLQNWLGSLFGGGNKAVPQAQANPTTTAVGQAPIRSGGYAGRVR